VNDENSKGLRTATMALDEHAGSFCVATRGLNMDRRRQWTFVLNDDGSWGWQVSKPDGTHVASKRSFKKLTECTADAQCHGYVVWQQEERRQAERVWKDTVQKAKH
jgi:hypothetical protein